MAMFGIPHEVLQGALVGLSIGSVIIIELPADSALAKVLMKDKTRRMITSTAIGVVLGILTDPMTTIIAELPIYCSMCIKGRKVEKQIKAIARKLEPGQSTVIRYQGHEARITKKFSPSSPFVLSPLSK